MTTEPIDCWPCEHYSRERTGPNAWLDRWGVEYGQEAMEQTEDAVLAAWQAHREQARAALEALRSKIAQERTT